MFIEKIKDYYRGEIDTYIQHIVGFFEEEVSSKPYTAHITIKRKNKRNRIPTLNGEQIKLLHEILKEQTKNQIVLETEDMIIYIYLKKKDRILLMSELEKLLKLDWYEETEE